VVEAGVAARRARLRVLVEDEDVLGAVAEHGERRLVGVHAQPERGLVPGHRAVDVRDGEVHGAELQAGVEGHADRVAHAAWRAPAGAYGPFGTRPIGSPTCLTVLASM
jgi:hypothetical protein